MRHLRFGFFYVYICGSKIHGIKQRKFNAVFLFNAVLTEILYYYFENYNWEYNKKIIMFCETKILRLKFGVCHSH